MSEAGYSDTTSARKGGPGRAMARRPCRQHPAPGLDRSGDCDDDVIEDEFLDLLDVLLRQATRIKRRQLNGQVYGEISRHIASPGRGVWVGRKPIIFCALSLSFGKLRALSLAAVPACMRGRPTHERPVVLPPIADNV